MVRTPSFAFSQGRLNHLFFPGSQPLREVSLAIELACNRLPRKPSLVHREIFGFAHDDRSLNHVLQFANVTRPGIRLKQVQTLLFDPPYILSCTPRATMNEILNQHRNIFLSFPQRRHLNRKNVEPVKQVATKGAGSDGCPQVTVGGRNHSNICLDGSSSADTLKFVFLQNTQERDLGLEGKFTDFIEEDRTSLRHFEPAQAPLQRSSKRPFLMPKQFGCDQIAGNGSAIHAHKCARRAMRTPVNSPRDKLFACPGFACDQNTGVCGSNLRHKREYFLQDARTPDDLVAHRSLIDFFGQGDALLFDSLFRLLWIRHDYRDASHNLPHRSRNVARLLDPFVHVAHSGAGPVWGQPQMESPWTPYRNRRNALLRGVGTNSKVVRDLILSISNVDALPSKKTRIDRPTARSEQCQGGTKSSQHDATPRISRMREGLPQREDRHKHSRDGRP